MKKYGILFIEFFSVCLIYILGYIYSRYAVQFIVPLYIIRKNWYLAIFLQMLILSVLPIIIAKYLQVNNQLVGSSRFLLIFACILPFTLFINSLYFITHAVLCNDPMSSDLFVKGVKVLIASFSTLLIVIAIRSYSKNRLYILFFFGFFYVLDILFVQGWFVALLNQL